MMNSYILTQGKTSDFSIWCARNDEDLYISENNECEVDNGGCNYRCLQTPQGAICICPEGQQLNGSKICVGKLLMKNTE